MNFWFWNIFGVTIVCALLTAFFIPQILRIAYKRNLLDVPDARKIHVTPIPRLGGIAFEPAIFLGIALFYCLNLSGGQNLLRGIDLAGTLKLAGCFCGLQILFLMGLADDLSGVRYRMKFLLQVVVGAILVLSGIYFRGLDGILEIYSWPLWVAYPFTVIVIIFLINSINLIDGIDGLASGLAMIAAGVYGVAFLIAGNYVLAMLACATLGALFPFFCFNMFGTPARKTKIFMGDTGSLSVGLLLTFMGIEVFSEPQMYISEPPYYCVLAFSPFIIPAFDVVRVYLHRMRNHQPPFLPDKNHIHHKLMEAGMTQHQALVTLLGASLLFLGVNLLLVQWAGINTVVLVDILLWVVLNKFVNEAMRRRATLQ